MEGECCFYHRPSKEIWFLRDESRYSCEGKRLGDTPKDLPFEAYFSSDENGNVYYSNISNDEVGKLDKDNKELWKTQTVSPRGLCAAGDGFLYVACNETENERIERRSLKTGKLLHVWKYNFQRVCGMDWYPSNTGDNSIYIAVADAASGLEIFLVTGDVLKHVTTIKEINMPAQVIFDDHCLHVCEIISKKNWHVFRVVDAETSGSAQKTHQPKHNKVKLVKAAKTPTFLPKVSLPEKKPALKVVDNRVTISVINEQYLQPVISY